MKKSFLVIFLALCITTWLEAGSVKFFKYDIEANWAPKLARKVSLTPIKVEAIQYDENDEEEIVWSDKDQDESEKSGVRDRNSDDVRKSLEPFYDTRQ